MKVCMQETESVMSAPRHPVPWVPRLPRKTTVDVSLCHACHAKWRWTWVLPRLPRKAKVDVRLCHACHAKVRLCHACHVKSRWMSPSATPATQKWRGVTGVTAAPKPGPRAPPSAICPTPATWNQGGCHQVPRLPRRSGAASRASRRRLNPAQGRHPGPSVPRLPRKTTVDVRLCHACHVKSRWMSPSATPATQKWRGVTGVTAAPKPGPRAPPSAICPTPATQNDGKRR